MPIPVTCVDYVWIGSNNEIHSKTRVLDLKRPSLWDRLFLRSANPLRQIPYWNFDGSSTGQAESSRASEIVLRPVFVCPNPLVGHTGSRRTAPIIVLCDVIMPKRPGGEGAPKSRRVWANLIMNSPKVKRAKPWFGLEQEYFLLDPATRHPIGVDSGQEVHYCSTGPPLRLGRMIAEEHMAACIAANLTISGINAEVETGQWEFQIGPCVGIDQGDHMWVARYLLKRIAEKHNLEVSFKAKVLDSSHNGSGCHANFSTANMRAPNGILYIDHAITALSKKHAEHMRVYGEGNVERMTGKNETSSFTTFTFGVGDRSASVRIGNETAVNRRGYLEDRRPSSDCDPYTITGKLAETIIIFYSLPIYDAC